MSKVRESLDGLEIRNAMRQAARRQGAQIRQIYVARKEGKLDLLDLACNWLTLAGVHWSDESYYGVTLLYAASVTLAYLPNGHLNTVYSPRLLGDEPEQFTLFTGEPNDDLSASPAQPDAPR